ncbi:alpha-L-rhamnosidase [Aspergillus brunneoviolaceus CBS 621.78]|uniref:Alpha-L-rhamnosidase n=1 Tax=Aspergillus brunneoviolaceus CBS 621.78 TaxID=1450534 RepID=A0ACD1FZX2_9EURO|nr:alpha-L-rhamnosidase [Aspergillus brunneoviolaceus CBS 621.78]RAH42503.1 alpha-L-rhamnosidase [Aspergillus brunneoviolaceus CBS 621.78]
MEITRCGIHGFHEVLGIDVDEIRFFWLIASTQPNASQKAYRVVLTTDESSLRDDIVSPSKLAWDSGYVTSNEQRNIICKPDNGFQSTCSYYWRVTVWDQSDQSFHSAPNHFFTAYPRSHLLPPYSMNQTYMPHTALIFRTWFEDEPNRWKAVWIGDGGDKPIYVRKSFDLSRTPVRAILFASGLGHFNMSVNGRTASDHRLDPGWTNYHRRVQFTSYDVTAQLQKGQNVLGAHVGNGFYAGDKGDDRFFWPMYEDNTYVRYGNELCFFSELHLFYEDGEHTTLISDPTWRVSKSATTLANIYASETHDRRLYPTGWDAPGFDDAHWAPAKPLTGPRGHIYYQTQPPVVLHETFKPIKTHSPSPGIVCYDLGQNASTMVEVVVEGAAGSEIIVRYSETVKEDGTVLMPDPLFKEFETGVFSRIYLAGTGAPEVWEPDFSFTSARYIQVEGVSLDGEDGHPKIISVVGRHISSAARQLGTMKTDKEDVNALLNACYWTFSSNLFSYHTDCPQIEKFGWLEVTHLLAPATQYIRDMESLYTKILDDILDSQEPSGLVPTMAPEIRYMCGPLHDTITWGCALCFLPDILRQYYGSTHVIAKVFPAAVRYMEYMRTKERRGGLIEHGLGDWGRGIAHGNNQANIETAIYYRCLQNVEMMARELGETQKADEFQQWAARIYAAYNHHLLVTDDPSRPHAYYTSLDNYPERDRDAIAQAIALQFGMVPQEHRADVMAAFMDDVADGRMRSGEIGLRFLFNTLADAKRPDLVLQMARQEEHPSYMRFLRRGETTLLEFWQDACRSKCHDMLGTIYEWFYAAVLGLKPTGLAYRTFVVDPPYEVEFDHVQGSVDCPYGLITVEFTRDAQGAVTLSLRVPFGTTAVVKLPENAKNSAYLRAGEAKQSVEGDDVRLTHGEYSVFVQL